MKADTYPDLASALAAIIPAGTRVLGFGEMHSRTDRAQVTSALSHFTTEGLPAIADRLSDLVVETWIVDPTCGQAAKTATAKVEITMPVLLTARTYESSPSTTSTSSHPWARSNAMT